MSITAIALDRYIQIVCALKIRKSNTKATSLRTYSSILICVFIWLFAFLLSSPLFIYNITTHISVSLNEPSLQSRELESFPNDILDSKIDLITSLNRMIMTLNGTFLPFTKSSEVNSTQSIKFNENIYSIYHCVENWPSGETRMIYSYSSLLIQYILPIIIVGLAYGSIWWKLKNHRKNLKNHTKKLNPHINYNNSNDINSNKDAVNKIRSNLLSFIDTTGKKKTKYKHRE